MSVSRHSPRRRRWLRLSALVTALVVTLGGLAVVTDALGAGRLFDRAVAKIDRMLAGPVPDRPTVETVLVTPRPATSPSPNVVASASPVRSTAPRATPTAEPTPQPTPARVAVDLDI